MQIVCGQCGQHLELDGTIETTSVVCPKCSHEINLAEGRSARSDEGGFAERARKLLSEQIAIECQNCSLRLKVPNKFAGRVIRCPGCGESIKIASEVFDPEAFSHEPADTTEQATLAAAVERVESERKDKSQKTRQWGTLRQWIVLATAGFFVGAVVLGINILKKTPQHIEVQEPEVQEENPAAASSQPAIPRRVAPSYIEVEKTAWSVFANPAGYFPAGIDRRYLVVSVNCSAGPEGISFNPSAGGARIETDSNVYRCVGVALPKNAGAIALADVRPVKIAPGKTRSVNLLFELPAKNLSGRVVINNTLDATLSVLAPRPPSEKFAGDYEEKVPRNLEPMLTDKVMRQIQKSPPMRMSVTAAGDNGWAMNIPQAQVTGSAVKGSRGEFITVLQHRGNRLACKAIMPDDNTVILYLDDEPMHQMVFVKK